MNAASTASIDRIWEQVRQWSSGERRALAARILESLHPERDRSKTVTLADLRGLLATDQAPPTDSDVDRILEEERIKKFG